MNFCRIWIIFTAFLNLDFWFLSFIHELNERGYAASIFLILGLTYLLLRANGKKLQWKLPKYYLKLKNRFSRVIPFIYVLALGLSLFGGIIHSPNNYDALCYRLPRILYWCQFSGWHWIGGINERMDYSAIGYEVIAAPILSLFRSDRPLFLINIIAYSLLPGIIYSAFSGLGIPKKVSWNWMWIIPLGYCYATQAGGVGNDMFAATYFLAAVALGIQAIKERSAFDALLSITSAALLTGAKSSNLPLLLPLGYILWKLALTLLRKPVFLLCTLSLFAICSTAPIMVANKYYDGSWFGDLSNAAQMKVENPVYGIAGNILQLTIASLEPPLLPVKGKIDALLEKSNQVLLFDKIKRVFPRLELKLKEMPGEEFAGLGLGVSSLTLASVIIVLISYGDSIASSRAIIFGLLCWIATIVFMTRIGSECTGRLLAAYYPGLIIPFLALKGQEDVIRQSWWRIGVVAAQLCIIPSLLLGPSRPIIPVSGLIHNIQKKIPESPFVKRVSSVYSIYSNRGDFLSVMDNQVLVIARCIGFGGSSNQIQYPLWKPFFKKKVLDLGCDKSFVNHIGAFDCFVVTKSGLDERFHTNADEFSQRLHSQILWRGAIPTLASTPDDIWYLLGPARALNESKY